MTRNEERLKSIRFGITDCTGNPMSPWDFFGADTKVLDLAFKRAIDFWLNSHNTCYKAPVPTFSEYRTELQKKGKTFTPQRYLIFRKNWYKAHPEEAEMERKSKASFEAEKEWLFAMVNRIAEEHNVALRWCGNGNPCCGDKWVLDDINGNYIGVITYS